ncbi:MAG: hypothetical protein HY313_03925 [Acidobacteria bacterium]|nr:hypothetical protein [Acidobacteriota bacterium]
MRIRNFRQIIPAVGAACGQLVAERSFAYCAMCQTALSNSPEGQQLAGGLNGGVLFLLTIPFLVAGSVLFLIFKGRFRAAVKRVTGIALLKFAPRNCFSPARNRL